MATVTVRNVPPRVLKALKTLARRNRRSMEQEVRALLETVVLDRKSACDQIEAAWKLQKRPTRRGEVDRWIRESRP